MCSQRGIAKLQLDYEIYTATVDSLSAEISTLTQEHSKLKLMKCDTYDLAQKIRDLGMQKARAEGKAMQIEKVLYGDARRAH